MDNMLPSPSYQIPSIGTPHHALEEDQVITANNSAANNQQQQPQAFNAPGYTPQTLLNAATPQNLLNSPAPNLLSNQSQSQQNQPGGN